MFDNPDSLVVFSAGNSGTGGVANSVTSPSTAKNALTVGASFNDHSEWLAYLYFKEIVGVDDDPRDDIKTLAGFSSRGPTKDKRVKPDVVAPGCAVTSAQGFDYSPSSSATADAHCDVQPLMGTSMACPLASALASKVRQYFRQGYYPQGKAVSSDGFSPSGALIKAILVHSGQPLSYIREDISVSEYSTNIKYPDTNQGYGRIQLNAVLHFGNAASLNPINLFVIGASDPKSPHYKSFSYGDFVKKVSYVVKFNTSSDATVVNLTPIRITMTYTDYPASASSPDNLILVNKLVVTCSSGDKSYFSTGSFSAANVQVIDIIKPTVGTTYIVTVTATKLGTSTLTSNKDQPFALVITGANQYLADDFEPSATSGYVSSLDSSSSSSDFTASTSAMPFVIALTIVAAILIPMAMLAGYLAMQSYKGGGVNDFEEEEGDESEGVRRPRSIFGYLVLLTQFSGTQSNARPQQSNTNG